MSKKYIISLTILLVMSIITTEAQELYPTGNLSGKASSNKEKTGMSKAKISLLQDESIIKETITDKSGNYKFEDIPIGVYSIRVESADEHVLSLKEYLVTIRANRNEQKDFEASKYAYSSYNSYSGSSYNSHFSYTRYHRSGIQGNILDIDGETLPFTSVAVLDTTGVLVSGTDSDFDGNYRITLDTGIYDLEFSYVGLETFRREKIKVFKDSLIQIDVIFSDVDSTTIFEDVQVIAYKIPLVDRTQLGGGQALTASRRQRRKSQRGMRALGRKMHRKSVAKRKKRSKKEAKEQAVEIAKTDNLIPETDQLKTVELEQISEGPIVQKRRRKDENHPTKTASEPLSTFSVDVDNASYVMTRLALGSGRLPARKTIRTEEFLNYFNYEYAEPKNQKLFVAHTELATCPWNNDVQLLQIGLQSNKRANAIENMPNNLVFLVDISGSMSNELPLLKASLKLLVDQLDEKDRVAIVAYAGNASVALPSTLVRHETTILKGLDKLSAGGSTNGEAGLNLAYQIAEKNYIHYGNNRIIVVTDGDFNVGTSDSKGVEDLIAEKRKTGVFLTILGMGGSTYGSDIMETIADKGNGVYLHLDSEAEATKIMTEGLGGTLHTLVKDVKIQIEFDPKIVNHYRQIGYINRKLRAKDFEDDSIDGGDLGLGHSVTALYELKLNPNIDTSTHMGEIRIRYKAHNADTSQLIETPITLAQQPKTIEEASKAMQLAAGVTGWTMLMRKSDYIQESTFNYENVIDLVELSAQSDGTKYYGERQACMSLIAKSQKLDKKHNK